MFKEDFPILSDQKVVYLDSAASAQKPADVLSAMDDFYRTTYANVHRGQYTLAGEATTRYEQARKGVADFIGAKPENIVFTRGATDSINLVSDGYARLLKAGDEVLISISEHHANFVPWQQVCQRTGATFKVFGLLPDGQWDLDDFRAKLSDRTKLVAVTQLSNVLGIVNPVKSVIEDAHRVGARVLVDGAQGIAHMPVDVTDLGCDYYVFSGHKIYGPTGIGVLYGRPEALEALPPVRFGGDMIRTVSVEKTTFADIPARFEAGTPPIAEAVGLAAALKYVSRIGMPRIQDHETELTRYMTDRLGEISEIEWMGSCLNKQGLAAFNIRGIHPADIAFVLAKENVCVRVGHHCAMPLHHAMGVQVSLRASVGLYNDRSDIDRLIQGLNKAIHLLGEGL